MPHPSGQHCLTLLMVAETEPHFESPSLQTHARATLINRNNIIRIMRNIIICWLFLLIIYYPLTVILYNDCFGSAGVVAVSLDAKPLINIYEHHEWTGTASPVNCTTYMVTLHGDTGWLVAALFMWGFWIQSYMDYRLPGLNCLPSYVPRPHFSHLGDGMSQCNFLHSDLRRAPTINALFALGGQVHVQY